MFDFIPQILIIIALAGIIIIIVKRFSKATELGKKEELSKASSSKGFWGRLSSLCRIFGQRFQDFSILVFKKIYSRFKGIGTKKKEEKKSETTEEVSSLVREKPKVGIIADENKILDLLEQAAKFFGSGNFKKAEKLYIEIVKLDSTNTRAYKGLGKIYKKQGNIKDAKASFEQVLKIKPGDSEAREELQKLDVNK